jgi:osmotically-inducible protein OsmY
MPKLILATFVALTVAAACAPKNVARQESATASRPETIETRARAALLNAPNVHASEIQIEVTGQVVTLRGEVHGQQEIDAAVAAVRAVPGVQEVKSELRPKSEPVRAAASRSLRVSIF